MTTISYQEYSFRQSEIAMLKHDLQKYKPYDPAICKAMVEVIFEKEEQFKNMRIENQMTESVIAKAIIKEVKNYYKISEEEWQSRSRKVRNKNHKRVAIFLIHRHCKSFRLSQIGDYVGGYDHSTVSYHLDVAASHYGVYPDFKKEVNQIEESFLKNQ